MRKIIEDLHKEVAAVQDQLKSKDAVIKAKDAQLESTAAALVDMQGKYQEAEERNKQRLEEQAKEEMISAEQEMFRIVESYPVGSRENLRFTMQNILRAKATYKIQKFTTRHWVVKHPWKRTPEEWGCSETSVGGLILLLYELVGLPDVGYGPAADALGVVERLMSAIPQSTFHQISEGYAMVWDARDRARFKSSELENLFLFAMLELGELIAERFNNMRSPRTWTLDFKGREKDLVAPLARALMFTSPPSRRTTTIRVTRCLR
jgi:hypothetical protein